MVYIGIIVVIFVAELLIKNHIDKNWEIGKNKLICKDKIKLTKYKNRGAFLNFLDKRPKLIAIISLIFSLLILAYFIVTLGQQGNTLFKTGLALLLGGAFSNTYDRLSRKYVVDYFSFRSRFKRLNQVVFNLADIFIMIGAIFVVLGS
jgi:signal peptidase II